MVPVVVLVSRFIVPLLMMLVVCRQEDTFSNKFFPIRFYVSQSTIEFCVVKSITHIYIAYIVSLFGIFSKYSVRCLLSDNFANSLAKFPVNGETNGKYQEVR